MKTIRSSILVLSLFLFVRTAGAAEFACTEFTPPTPVDVSTDLFAFDARGWDYYSIYLTDREGQSPEVRVIVYHGDDHPKRLGGMPFKIYTSADFTGIALGENRLVTPAEWITQSPIRVEIQAMFPKPVPIAYAAICFGRIKPPSTAPSGSLPVLMGSTGPALVGLLLLRRRTRQA